MRAPLFITLLLSLTVAACAGTIPPNKHIPQSGTLKVNPGLLGQPVPAEPQTTDAADQAKPTADQASKPDLK